MSSFTDTPHGFNPYVKTLPVDSYTQVGIYKEQNLEEGIGKVQQYVDSINGLPIDKEATRQYVQGKLGEIKKALGENISGDFSDSRLVNQIGGATAQIASDPIVVNGMAGTAAIRAGSVAITEAKKSGKGYGVQNEAKFNSLASEWQNDGDPTTQFNSSYTPYVDVIGRAMELYKSQNNGQNLPEGAFRYNENGKLEVNPVLMEGVSANRIKSVLDLVYQQPDIQQQLSIDGWYNYRGASQTDLAKVLAESTNNNLDSINDTIKSLQLKLVTDANADASSITKQIEDLKVHAEDVKKGYNSNINTLKTNPDAIKSKLVKDGITSSFINAYATQVMKKSPLWDAHMEQVRYELDLAKEAKRKEEWQKTYDYNKEKDLLDFKLKANKNNKDDGGGVTSVLGNISEEAGKLNSNTFDKLVAEKEDTLNQALYEFVFKMGLGADNTEGTFNPIKKVPGGGYDLNVDESGRTGFKTKELARAEYRRIYADSRSQMMGGTATPELLSAFKELDPKIDETRYYQETKKQLDSDKEEVLNQIRKDVSVSNPDYVDAFIVKNKLAGWEKSESKLKQKYAKEENGYDWESGMGIDKTNFGDIGSEVEGRNYKDYKKFENKFDPTLASKFQEIEDKYAEKQTAYLPIYTTINVGTPEEKEILRTKFSGFSTVESEGNYSYKPFRELLSEDKRGDYKTNIYGGYQDPLNKKYYLTVKRGKGQPEKMEVKKEEFESILGPSTNPFWEKYGPRLSLTQNTTTDVPINGKAGGINSAYTMERPSESKYDVRYHVINSGNGYNLKMYIKDRATGETIVGPVSPGLSTTMEGINSALSELSNDALIEAIINQNKKP